MADTRTGDFDAPGEHPGGLAWSETDLDYGLRPQVDSVEGHAHFDAFATDTWNFKPAPAPWHESPRARLGIVAVALAVVALVISIVLLAVTGSGDEAPRPQPSAPPTTTPSSTATTTAPSLVAPPPVLPPPPPPTTEAPPPVYQRPREQPRQTKEPEINVTRTPVTRSQLSVAPQRPGNRN